MRDDRAARVVATMALAIGGLAWIPTQAREAKRPGGEKYALLVGVRQYDPKELKPLPYAEPDVVELAQVLRDQGYRRVVLMTQAEAVKKIRFLPAAAFIRNELGGLLEDLEPADTIVVALAGHGVQFQGEATSYFCPMDAKLADRSTLISLDEVYRSLEGCRAGTRLLLVDACRNDPQSDNARSRSQVRLESVTRPQASRPPGGIAAFFSCSEGQKAYEDDAIRHGVFFHFVIDGLKGGADLDKDGSIDLEELALFTRKRVMAYVKDEYGADARQVPVLKGEVAGLAALVRLDRGGETGLRPGKPKAKVELKVVESPAKREMALRTPPAVNIGEPGERKTITNGIGMKLVLIPAGEFEMGSGAEDKDAEADEKPRHRVRITRPFFLGTTEVTQSQYQAVRGENPSYSKGSDDLPVEKVSWDDAIAFCNKLSEREGLKPYYQFGSGAQSGGDGYRLPTEAEWEYACRAGSSTRYHFGDDEASLGEYAWFDGNSEFKTHPVGQKRPNAFGLYDMHGNVEEWCWDGFAGDLYKNSSEAGPSGRLLATDRVSRGGSWDCDPRLCWAALRNGRAPGFRFAYLGFRVARVRSGS